MQERDGTHIYTGTLGAAAREDPAAKLWAVRRRILIQKILSGSNLISCAAWVVIILPCRRICVVSCVAFTSATIALHVSSSVQCIVPCNRPGLLDKLHPLEGSETLRRGAKVAGAKSNLNSFSSRLYPRVCARHMLAPRHGPRMSLTVSKVTISQKKRSKKSMLLLSSLGLW